ncbi:hypothetical protein AB5J52_30475 [Streptomyces sp. R39]|uniref:Alpha/beta hydrolase n=1 Tax=Streptomyces sp. R39 TaxID=3238631 RepID=A0AB39RA46_9ACTN
MGEPEPSLRARHLDFADIDSDHRPMVPRPAQLDRILATAAGTD